MRKKNFDGYISFRFDMTDELEKKIYMFLIEKKKHRRDIYIINAIIEKFTDIKNKTLDTSYIDRLFNIVELLLNNSNTVDLKNSDLTHNQSNDLTEISNNLDFSNIINDNIENIELKLKNLYDNS